MDDTRAVIRARRLEKYARILADNYRIHLQVIHMNQIGCCDSDSRILINTQVNKDEFKNLILQKALTLHELGHILFTESKAWKRNIDRNLSNVIKDGRVEEGVSRLYPKARLYFMYLNREVLPYKDSLTTSLEKRISQLILRESMKKTGAPPLPKKVHNQLKQELGNDYNWFLEKTREAVETRTERQAARITKKIEEQIRIVCQKNSTDNFDNVSATSPVSTEHCGDDAENMPRENQQSEELAEQIMDSLQSIQDQEDEEYDEDENEENTNEIPEQDDDIINNTLPIIDDDSPEQEDEDDDDIDDTNDISKDEHEEDQDIDDESDEHENDEDDNEKDDDIEIDSTVENFVQVMSNQLEHEAGEEIMNESETIKSCEASPDFSSYFEKDNGLSTMSNRYDIAGEPINTVSLDPLALRLSQIFKIIAQRGDGWSHHQTRGKLEMHRLPSIATSPTNMRVFKRKVKKEFADLSVIILLDGSGSMHSIERQASETAYVIAKSLELGKYNVEVVVFAVRNTDYDYDIYGIKSFNQKMEYAKNKFAPISSGDSTPILPALFGAEKSFSKIQSKRKLLFVITDAAPNDYDSSTSHEEYIQKCKQEINRLESKDISVVGIMLGCNDNYELFRKGKKFRCNDITDLPNQMSTVIKNVLMKVNRVS